MNTERHIIAQIPRGFIIVSFLQGRVSSVDLATIHKHHSETNKGYCYKVSAIEDISIKRDPSDYAKYFT